MKMLKKLSALLLVGILTLTMSISAFAANTENVKILTNNATECVVEEITEEGTTRATNHKDTGLLVIEKFDETGNTLISTETLDLNAISRSVMAATDRPTLNATRAAYNEHNYQHTFTNREYDCYVYNTYTQWDLRSGDRTKSVRENSSNSSNLESFRGYVEEVNSQEFKVIGVVGSTAAVSIFTGILSGGLAGGIAAAGGAPGVVAVLADLNSAMNSADHYYDKIK